MVGKRIRFFGERYGMRLINRTTRRVDSFVWHEPNRLLTSASMLPKEGNSRFDRRFQAISHAIRHPFGEILPIAERWISMCYK
jgi:hypothetical protein